MDAITQIEVEEQRAKFRALGIGQFTISGMDEDASIRHYLDEKSSFLFAFVRNPYSRGKLASWRLFQVNKKEPNLPMGYRGCPGFLFECYDGTAEQTAKEIANRIMSKSYTWSKREFDCFAMKEAPGTVNPLFYKLNEDSRKYLRNHSVSTLKWS